MKNYLIGAVRPVSTTWGHWKTQEEEAVALQGHKKYKDMYNVSRASARKFLQGQWEEIMFQAPVLDNRLYQIAQWYCIKELWHREPCNILCMGADTMFIKPTEFFGRFKEMRLFNYTDPRQHDSLKCYNDGTGHYFNDDIRYYPATMDPKSWENGEKHMLDWWPNGIWDCGQLIHNHQFWCQDIPANDILHPELAFQMTKGNVELDNQWNGINIQHAHVLHLHGSRNADDRVQIMNQLAHNLGIPLPNNATPNVVTINI